MCGIKIGEQVTFDPTGLFVKVASDDSIEYEGRIYKLTPFVGPSCPTNIVIPLVPIKVPSISHITGKCWMRLGKRKKQFNLDKIMGALVEINTDGLAKLADTISFAFGGTARGERKMAEAKAYAAELEAKTNNKVALIKAQGEEVLANYVAVKESRKLRNTIAVIEKAQSHFTEGEKVSDEPVDEGWKNRFFNIVEEISDEELREIWGRVLAGEIKKPKSYSLRTLEILRNLTKEEAAIIVKAAPFIIKEESLYKDSILSITETLILRECGLIIDEGLGLEYHWEIKGHDSYCTSLTNRWVLGLQNDSDSMIKLRLQIYKLSTAGREIITLISVSDADRQKFFKLLANTFKSKGISHVLIFPVVSIDGDNINYEEKGIEI